MTCPYEGTDDTHESMVCTLHDPFLPVNQDIPSWCPLLTVEVGKDMMVRLHSLLSCLKHRYGHIMEEIGEYQEITELNDMVQQVAK